MGAATGRQLRFRDRREAGRVLAGELERYAGRDDVIVLALPRGGVSVASEVAKALRAPLDVLVVRKLGVPGHEELAMGAIASGGGGIVDRRMVNMLGISEAELDRVLASEMRELDRREAAYRDDRGRTQLAGKTVIVVDDGLATGSTMQAAVRAVRRLGPARIVVAVPVAAAEACEALRQEADDIVCALTPTPFHSVGVWYEDFPQTSDDEVRELLARAATQTESTE